MREEAVGPMVGGPFWKTMQPKAGRVFIGLLERLPDEHGRAAIEGEVEGLSGTRGQLVHAV